MRTLTATLTAAQKGTIYDYLIKITFSKAGESDIVVEQDRILEVPTQVETTDSQTIDVVFNNSDGYFTSLALEGWAAVFQWGLVTTNGSEYSPLPPFKVIAQSFSSAQGILQCSVSLIGIPDRLASDKASTDYEHHWSDTKTVKAMITEIANGTAVTTELTEQQTDSNSYIDLNGAGANPLTGVGQRLNIPNRTVTKLSFKLKKVGSPAGTTVEFRITDVATYSTLASKTFAISGIGTSAAYCEATLDTPLVVNEDVWIVILYNLGTETDYISVAYNTIAVKISEWIVRSYTIGSPSESWETTDEECAYKYKYNATGIGVFSHCESYTATFDSEDSLIDVYQPQDSFKITEGSSRLDAINRLLAMTKCVKRVEDDGELHIFVPTTTGTTYNYEYSLTAGDHAFFSKAIRNALVVPNRVVVHSLPTDDNQYTGSATSATSYALLPISNFIRTRLVSNAQATSIAESIIAQLEIDSQRGAATVPNNLGAEVYDYVKVTDSRQSDSRVGNLGYIRRSSSPGTKWDMAFNFGILTLKDLRTTKPQLLRKRLSEAALANEAFVRFGFLKDQLGIITDGIDYIADAINTLADIAVELASRIQWLSDQEDTESLINSYLITYRGISNLIEDTTPQLGGDLDLNGHNIDFPSVANISDCKDEDTMTSNSDTMLATQQSIKAYADTKLKNPITTTATDVSGSNSLDPGDDSNTYRPSTSYPTLVVFTATMTSGDTVAAYIGSSDPPTSACASLTNTDADATQGSMSFIVPAGWWYKIANIAVTPTVAYWWETTFGG